MDVGTKVEDNCITEFNNMKLGKKHRYLIFSLVGQDITIEKIGVREETYEQFVASLPTNEARYAIFDYEYDTHDSPPRHVQKLVFFFWSPDAQNVKTKMLYAAAKESLKKKLTGLQVEVQANGFDDLDAATVQKEVQ